MACHATVISGWASTSTVIWGCVAFVVWWVFSVFPAVPVLPIGRTAGSVLGAILMVVFQVLSPDCAFAAVDLPILGLLWGTMVISVYLKRAGLFIYLEKAMMWKSRGGMDILCRLCLLSALSSALFTNDTTCVVLTGFVLKLCREKVLSPKPFLLALACSSNIGSAATPIGNPQNLVIAVSSGISFGRFLSGVLPTVAVGLIVNTLLLMAVYGRSLSVAPDTSPVLRGEIPSKEAGHVHVELRCLSCENTCDRSPYESTHESIELRRLGLSARELPQVAHIGDAGDKSMERQNSLKPGAPSEQSQSEIIDSSSSKANRWRGSSSTAIPCDSLEAHLDAASLHKCAAVRAFWTVPCDDLEALIRGLDAACVHTKRSPCEPCGAHIRDLDAASVHKKRSFSERCAAVRMLWREKLWKPSVYLVTIGMLAALLAGLSLPWTAITAAVGMMLLDLSDAGPSLEQVTYTLLVFFSGMFIATSGFNATGAPEEFWLAVEPHSRIDSASGVSVLSLVVTVLSNVVSNVPTVILLGSRVAQSAANSGVSSDKAWLILAWVSTVAGNLTLVGSAANLIVSEQARPTPADKLLREEQPKGLQGPGRATFNLTFYNHIKFGFPSTLIVTAVGLLPLVFRKF